MNDFFSSIESSLGPTLWNLIVFVLILIAGYVVAKIVEALTRKGLRRTTLDNRVAAALSDRPETEIPTERYLSKGLFWLVMVFVFIAAFDALNLAAVSEPLSRLVTDILAFLPLLLGAIVLAIIAFVVASLLRMVTTKALHAANVDERVRAAGTDEAPAETTESADLESRDAAPRDTSLAKTLGDAVYYFVLLLFLPAILGTLGLEGILAPVQDLVNEIIGFLPNLLLAAIILVIGAFVAKILRNIVANLLAAAGTDRLSERVGLSQATGSRRLSDLIGLVIYVLVLIPVIVAALNALAVEAVTRPASAMLNEFLAAIPRVFVAALILAVAYVVGRLLASLVANVLEGVGFNRLFESIGFSRAHSAATSGTTDAATAAEETRLDTRTPSGIVGIIVLVGVMLFAAAEAATALELGVLATLIAEFTVLGGRVLLGLLIFGVGLYLANLAYSAVESSGTSQATVLAVAARVAILVLAGAMALKQMGLADSIINLAFGLILGAIAVAAAIAFGIGGRDLAREQLEKLRDRANDGAPDALKPDPREPGTEASRRDPRSGSA